MLGRRVWLKSLVVGALSLFPLRRALAQQGGSTNAAERLSSLHVTPLDSQLRFGLRAVTPQQKQFVNDVIMYVEQGKIPRAMVNLVFRWARQRNPSIPFPYFEYALRALSRRRGFTIP